MPIAKVYLFQVLNHTMCGAKQERCNGAVVDQDLYEQIVAISKDAQEVVTSRTDISYTLFRVSSESPVVEKVFNLLAKVGLTPKFQDYLHPREREKHFAVRTSWHPTQKQLKSTEYFQITALWRNSSNVGKLLGMDPDHLAHISADSEQWRRPTELAELRERLFVVSDLFRQCFELAGLVGLKLHDITWYYQARWHGWDEVDPIEDPRRRLWMGSSVRMPPCLTPRRYTEGPEVGGLVTERKPEHRHCYDSEGLDPSILRFSRTAVEKLGKFDVAVTRERTHRSQEYMGPNAPEEFRDADYWLPDIIVSRRFKDWFTKSGLHGCRSVDFRIVELV